MTESQELPLAVEPLAVEPHVRSLSLQEPSADVSAAASSPPAVFAAASLVDEVIQEKTQQQVLQFEPRARSERIPNDPGFVKSTEDERAAARKCLQLMREAGKSRQPIRFSRQDALTGKWVHYNIGSGQQLKPREVFRAPEVPRLRIGDEEPHSSTCPFCSPSEAGDILRFEGKERRLVTDWSVAGVNGVPWQLRVVRNLYPTMSVPRECYAKDGYSGGFVTDHGNEINPNTTHPWYKQVSSVGMNEVIIETPLHNMCIPIESVENIALTLHAVVLRGKAIWSIEGVKYITVFKQHKCGSLVHAHTQIITTPFVPGPVKLRLQRAKEFHKQYACCPGCQILVSGPLGTDLARERLVVASDWFVATVPFASRSQYRVYIAPRRHSPNFFGITDEEIADLANVLRQVLRVYYHFLNDCPYNLAIWTCPVTDADNPSMDDGASPNKKPASRSRTSRESARSRKVYSCDSPTENSTRTLSGATGAKLAAELRRELRRASSGSPGRSPDEAPSPSLPEGAVEDQGSPQSPTVSPPAGPRRRRDMSAPPLQDETSTKPQWSMFHWYIGLYPRMRSTLGAQGFQIATDIPTVRCLPEDDAAQLREWLAELQQQDSKAHKVSGSAASNGVSSESTSASCKGGVG